MALVEMRVHVGEAREEHGAGHVGFGAAAFDDLAVGKGYVGDHEVFRAPKKAARHRDVAKAHGPLACVDHRHPSRFSALSCHFRSIR